MNTGWRARGAPTGVFLRLRRALASGLVPVLSWIFACCAPCSAQSGPAAAEAGAPAGGVWTQEAYVWQRRPVPVLEEARAELARERVSLDGVALLAAELSWRGGRAEAVYSNIDYKAPALRIHKRITLVLRAGPFPGPFEAAAPACRSLCAAVREVLARARAGGLEPAELQVDFDCAEAKLAGYAVWLGALRAECAGLRLSFTALPSWLGRPGFAVLAAAADGFVLQVHALEKPEELRSIPPLCDPVRAKAWVRRAGELGRPFRVALPSYGYLLAFGPQGRFRDFSSGGLRAGWPADTQLRELRADEAEMAALAGELRRVHPETCTGLLWFRLPAEGDALNWRWPAFAEVLRGGTPAGRVRAECIHKSDTLWELVLTNTGTASVLAPAGLAVSWPEGVSVRGGDGQGGAELRLEPGRRQAVFKLRARLGLPLRLEPGRARVLGWLRLEGGGEPLVEVLGR